VASQMHENCHLPQVDAQKTKHHPTPYFQQVRSDR
jgi:hypothetical protein